MRTPTSPPVIGSEPGRLAADWQEVAETLAQEVERLRTEVDRLSALGRSEASSGPLSSHADQGHPLTPLWVSLNLDRIPDLQAAWHAVMRNVCPKCEGPLVPGPYPPFTMCEDDNLAWIASDGHLQLDEIDRAIDRGPDDVRGPDE